MHPFARPIALPEPVAEEWIAPPQVNARILPLGDDPVETSQVWPVWLMPPDAIVELGPAAVRLWPSFLREAYWREQEMVRSGGTPGTAPFDLAARNNLLRYLEQLERGSSPGQVHAVGHLGAMAASVHQWARGVMLNAWRNRYGNEPSLAQIQSAQAIALLETSYGRGWPTAEGNGANNWGAIQCSKLPTDGVCPCDGWLHKDSYPTSSGQSVEYQVCFRRYASPEAGADAVLGQMSPKARPKTWAAMQTGDAVALSSALYDERYYQGFGATREKRIEGHVKAVERSVKAIAQAMGEPIAVARGGTAYGGSGSSELGVGPKIFLLASLAAAGIVVGQAWSSRG